MELRGGLGVKTQKNLKQTYVSVYLTFSSKLSMHLSKYIPVALNI
jgi:hypothetical protein